MYMGWLQWSKRASVYVQNKLVNELRREYREANPKMVQDEVAKEAQTFEDLAKDLENAHAKVALTEGDGREEGQACFTVSEVDEDWHTANWSIINETISGRSLSDVYASEDWRWRPNLVEPNHWDATGKETHKLTEDGRLSFPSYINEPSLDDYNALPDYLSEAQGSRPGTAPFTQDLPFKPQSRYQVIKKQLKHDPKKIEIIMTDPVESNMIGGMLYGALGTENQRTGPTRVKVSDPQAKLQKQQERWVKQL